MVSILDMMPPSIVTDLMNGDPVGDLTAYFDAAQGEDLTILVPAVKGIYPVDGLVLQDSVEIIGSGTFQNTAGLQCRIKASSSGSCITTTSRNKLSRLWVTGPAAPMSYTGAAGYGVEVGSRCVYDDIRVEGFQDGMRNRGEYWAEFNGVFLIRNLYGYTLDAVSSNAYSNVHDFKSCVIQFSAYEAIYGRYVPVRNHSLKYIGGSIEQNCQLDSSRAQVKTGEHGSLQINTFLEDVRGPGSRCDGIDLTGVGDFDIAIESSGAKRHIFAASGSCNNGQINANGRLLATDGTYAIDLQNCAGVVVGPVQSDKPFNLPLATHFAGSCIKIGGNQVLGPRQSGVSNSGDASHPDYRDRINFILGVLRTHGIIAP